MKEKIEKTNENLNECIDDLVIASTETKKVRKPRKVKEKISEDAKKLPTSDDSTEEVVELNSKGKPKKKKNYVNNKDLLKELALSHEQNKMTNNLAKMLQMLTFRYSQVPRFINYTYNEDMQSHAIFTLVKGWRKFDITKGSNPFAYFTQAIKHAFYQYDNDERYERDIKDEMLVKRGDNPSFSYLDRHGHDHNFEDNHAGSDSVVTYGSDGFSDNYGSTGVETDEEEA